MTHIGAWLIAALVGLVALLGGMVLSDHLEKRRQRKKEAAEGVVANVEPTPQATTPFPVVPPGSVVEGRKNEPLTSFRVSLEAARARGEAFKESFLRAFDEQAGKLDFDDALQAAFDMGFKMEDLVALMGERHHPLRAIAEFVNENENPDLERLFRVITPAATGDSVEEKAEDILGAVGYVFELGGEGDTLAKLLTDFGCSTEEAAISVYQQTDMNLGDVIISMHLEDKPELVVSLTKDLGVDLSDDGEYKALRDGAVDFSKAAGLLKACEKQVVEVLDTENSYEGSCLISDDLREALDDLLKAGFTREEVLDGIFHADFMNDQSNGAVVTALSDAGVSIDGIINLILKEDIDPDDLDGELSDANVDLRKRVELLHALFETMDRQKQPA